AGLVGATVMVRSRTMTIRVSAEPITPPLHLVLLDSWHSVVAGLANSYERAREHLFFALRPLEEFGIRCRWESYTFRTPTGFEQRERLVVSKGQCFVHVHLYRFED